MTDDPPAARLAPPAMLAQGAPAAVLAALPGARAVGGAVRDLLAGRAVHDIDIAAPLPPEAIAARLQAAGLKVFETGLAHGTVTAVLAGAPVEVTSLRRDVVTDGRHAQVAWTTDWREDAARRDFTINAMSLSAAGDLWDYSGGRDDLAAGRVRFVGDPATRLAEDYLRALRFFRFQARYGTGAPDPAAITAIRAAVPGLARLSAERVWMEVKRLLEAPDPMGALALMAETGVLGAVLPEGFMLGPLGGLVSRGAPPRTLLRFSALAPGQWQPTPVPRFQLQADWWHGVAKRFRLSTDERIGLGHRTRTGIPAPPASLQAMRVWIAGYPPLVQDPILTEDTLWLLEAREGIDLSAHRALISGDFAWPVFPLLGRSVLALGVPAGPEVGDLLSATRLWWIAQGCEPDGDACLAHLRELASARGLI